VVTFEGTFRILSGEAAAGTHLTAGRRESHSLFERCEENLIPLPTSLL
jgi:hypothetical protein